MKATDVKIQEIKWNWLPEMREIRGSKTNLEKQKSPCKEMIMIFRLISGLFSSWTSRLSSWWSASPWDSLTLSNLRIDIMKKRKKINNPLFCIIEIRSYSIVDFYIVICFHHHLLLLLLLLLYLHLFLQYLSSWW